MAYTPRPGSKTQAAIEFIRGKGGIASRIEIEDALDINRRDMNAIFSGAVGNGAMEPCEDAQGNSAYRIPDAKPETRAEQSAPRHPWKNRILPKKEDAALKISSSIPVLGKAAPAFWPGASAPKPKKASPAPTPEATQPNPLAEMIGRMATEPGPAPEIPGLARTFLCGRMSDGLLRIEGADADLIIEQFASGVHAITLSRAAAEMLTTFVRGD